MRPSDSKILRAAARRSPLSQVQVLEVEQELKRWRPEYAFKAVYVDSHGDIDQATSLRTMNKTDFFTREVDALVLSGNCRLAIHSAKDLPEPLPEALQLICLTHGVDSSDALVLREGQTLASLSAHAQIATSSVRREEAVRVLRHDLRFCDVRGNIGQRLQLLDEGRVDGVVIAEAALIRLGLTHRNRIRLPGSTTPLQGQLAVVARCDDSEMERLFSCMTCALPSWLG